MKKESQEPATSAPTDADPGRMYAPDLPSLLAIVGDCWRYFFTGHPDPLSLKSNQIKTKN
jgi:hypothetical protein